MKPIEFWFSIGSTYSYLTVMRLSAIENECGMQFSWHPFSVRALMQEMNNVPFVGKPAKEKYMWRDLERRAARYDLPIKMPVSYPLKNFDLANRVAIVAKQEGWCPEYVRATYQFWMQDGLPAGDEPNLSDSIATAGQNPARVIELGQSSETECAYLEATDQARSRGIFGSPSFVVDSKELFWGDDRLEDAVDFAACR